MRHDTTGRRRGTRPRLLIRALALLSGLLLAAALPAPASAHAALLTTNPEEGSNLKTARGEVLATFSEILDGPSTEIAVTGPEGETIDVEPATFDGSTFIQPMRYTVPGEYTVAFRVISEDGHRVDGSFSFTVAEIPEELYAEGAGPETEETDETTEAAAPVEDETEAEDTEAAEEESETSTGVIVAGVLIAVLVVAAGAVLIVQLVRRRKTAQE